MTRLFRNTGIEYEITYPPPPPPPPPPPDPEVAAPPGDNVKTEDSPCGSEPVERWKDGIEYRRCWVRDGEDLLPGLMKYVYGTPVGSCKKLPGYDPPEDPEGGLA